MADPKTISTQDGSMYVSKIGVDRRLNSDNQPQASATVMISVDGSPHGRATKTEQDLSELAETGTADQKSFANKTIEAIHEFEASPMMASKEIQSFARPAVLDTPMPQSNLAMAGPAPIVP